MRRQHEFMLMFLGRAACLLALAISFSSTALPAQSTADPAPPPVEPAPEAPAVSKTDTLNALSNSLSALLKTIQQKQAETKAAANTPAAEAIQKELGELEARRQVLEADFMAVAAGVSYEEYLGDSKEETPLSLEQELSRLLSPMVVQVRKLSKKPRAIQEMQEELIRQEQRKELASVAVTNLESQLKFVGSSKAAAQTNLAKLLQSQLATWQARLSETQSRVLALVRQIDELNKETTGVWDTLADAGRSFVLTRGRNILFAVLAFISVFFGMRLFYFYGLKLVPISKMERLSFLSRLLGLLNQSLSLALAVIAALAVLYASGDWLLGGIAMLVVIAIALAAKSGLMNYFEQVRMLLNLGSAREGERVLIDGVPWRIGKINLQTRLTNPCIDGPGMRLPMETLMKMTSRPSAKSEPWFPCRTDDTLLLADDILAKVRHISPDFVEITYRGGITRHIPTPEMIKMQPANLSEGYLVNSTLGLDYRHQADITARIPDQLCADIRAEFLKIVPEGQLLDASVVFISAAASSLDLLMIAKFSGAAAERFLDYRRLLQRFGVESCNTHGWGIPFPQLVVHQASAPG